MKAAYRTLYEKYNNVLKPLISEQEGRLETFAAPLLESLSRMLDAVSLADSCDDDVQRSEYVKVADEALDLSISYSYQYLIYALQKNVEAFEEKAPQSVRNRIDGGRFVGPYESQKNEIVQLLHTCDLQNDDIKSLPLYKNVYHQLIELERLINDHHTELVIAEGGKESWMKTIMLKGLSIVISILVGVIVGKYLAIWFL
jgi:hypothetical protein